MHAISGRWKLGLLLSLVTVMLWGLLPIALKGLLQYTDSYTITWLRFALAALFLGGYLKFSGKLPELATLSSHSLKVLMIIAIAGLLGNYIFYMIGLAYATPESAQVTVQLAPILFLFASLILFKESFNFKQWLGLIAFFVGLLLFFNQRMAEFMTATGPYVTGILFIIISAVFWAAYAVAQKQLLKHFASEHIMMLIYIAGTIVFLPISDIENLPQLDWLGVGLLLFCGLNTLIAYGAFAEALDHWEASRVSATLALTPLMTVIFTNITEWLFPGYVAIEPLNTISVIGAVVLVVGSAITALSKSNKS